MLLVLYVIIYYLFNLIDKVFDVLDKYYYLYSLNVILGIFVL